MMIYVLTIAFLLSFFLAYVVENEEISKEERYRWFAIIVGSIIYLKVSYEILY